jgi:hypothetical protein
MSNVSCSNSVSNSALETSMRSIAGILPEVQRLDLLFPQAAVFEGCVLDFAQIGRKALPANAHVAGSGWGQQEERQQPTMDAAASHGLRVSPL